jgi:N6-adenosine-specific RNA methylase IME4
MNTNEQTTPYQLLPPLSDAEYMALRDDIAARGVLVPIELDEHGNVLDGHHRLRACRELGITDYPRIVRGGMSEEGKVAHALTLNLTRRHLAAAQRRQAVLDARLRTGWSNRRLAELFGVDEGTIRGDLAATAEFSALTLPERTVGRDGIERPATRPAPFPTSSAAPISVMGNTIQEQRAAQRMIATNPALTNGHASSALLTVPDLRHTTRRALRDERLARLATSDAGPLPRGPFQVLYADPPWQFEFSETDSRALSNQYPVMDLEAICTMPVAEVMADDSILFLWVPSAKLEEGFDVVRCWGYSYRTCMVWKKPQMGMGYYARSEHELLLIARAGEFPPPSEEHRPRSVLEAPRGRHSAKPDAVYDLIEHMYPNASRLELFARGAPRSGWAAWGNEVVPVP